MLLNAKPGTAEGVKKQNDSSEKLNYNYSGFFTYQLGAIVLVIFGPLLTAGHSFIRISEFYWNYLDRIPYFCH